MKKSKSIALILGTRPEIIKFSPLVGPLREQFKVKIVFTGQHYNKELFQDIFQDLHLKSPDINLKIGSGSHADQCGRMMIELEKSLKKIKPDAVIVQGDTNTTLVGALTAKKMNIKVIHIEAGARCFNIEEPEEVNRVLVDHLADLNFSFSDESEKALNNEGLQKNHYRFDNTIYEATNRNKKFINIELLKKLKLNANNYILTTIHRASNTDSKQKLTKILKSLAFLAEKYKIVFPIHPRTKKLIKKYKIAIDPKIKIIKPVGYLELLTLLDNAKFVMSDSGGIIDESVVLNTPMFIYRDFTERTDILRSGKAHIIKPEWSYQKIIKELKAKTQEKSLESMKQKQFKYDKNIAQKMVRKILNFLNK